MPSASLAFVSPAPRAQDLQSGSTTNSLRACLLIAATYFHFLIFAQFAFLDRLAQWSSQPAGLKMVMAAMAAAGVLFSLLTAGPGQRWSPGLRLRASLALCSLSAFASVLSLNLAAALPLGFLIGASLAVLTVTTATELCHWFRANPWLWAALGTGIGYSLANVPAIFRASSSHQAIVSGSLCLAACLLPPSSLSGVAAVAVPRQRDTRWLPVRFLALVWLDSAAFYIIQHVPALKADTWQGNAHLWCNGALHLLAALLAGWTLRRFRPGWTLGAAYLLLAVACLLLQRPATAIAASVFYPCGVSLYSVALVTFPSLLAGGTASERARMAGWLYAIAGWMGSGLGIGMAEHLHRVPLSFVMLAGAVVLLPAMRWVLVARSRELVALLAAGWLCAIAGSHLPAARQPATAIERGRAVYISEGCIHCHSQYVRPGTADVLLWGPVRSIAQIHQDAPPLIGNRRQGPDLSMIGARRSPLWIRAHMIHPQVVSPGSIMPSYAILFADDRGNDLVAYLSSLRADNAPLRAQQAWQQESWTPSASAMAAASAAQGEASYRRHCAQCHDAQAPLRRTLRCAGALDYETIQHAPNASAPTPATEVQLARIVKFGKPGTDMPGHETLDDGQIASIARWLAPRVATGQRDAPPSSPFATPPPTATKE